MSGELKKKRSSMIIDKENKNTVEVSVLLELYTAIIKKDDSDKCICYDSIPQVDNKINFYESEIIPNIEVSPNTDDKVKLFDVITKLKQYGFPLSGAQISIYFKGAEDYLYVGSDPIDQNVMLDHQYYQSGLMTIRAITYIEEKLVSKITGTGSNTNAKIQGGGIRLSRNNSLMDKKKNKRTKERKIGYIVEKVNTWRKLYNGFYDEYSKFTKYSLDEAAKIIGISKKSLDDYLLQLRLGRKYGFDFNSNKCSKVGVLRSFVKTNRNPKND
jgi:hypothetical protein